MKTNLLYDFSLYINELFFFGSSNLSLMIFIIFINITKYKSIIIV